MQLATGDPLHTITAHTADVYGIAFTPDSTVLTSGAWDATVRSWDPVTGKHLETITGHSDVVVSVTYSADGSILATRSWDKTIRLWDADTGQLRHTLVGHQDDVDIVVFSPDGRTLASGSQDNTVRLWDAVTGEHVKTLRGHYSYLISLAFSPDGSILASGMKTTASVYGMLRQVSTSVGCGSMKQVLRHLLLVLMAPCSPAAVVMTRFAYGMSKHAKSFILRTYAIMFDIDFQNH